jgi:transcriptional regulator with XRE-family HTH domain
VFRPTGRGKVASAESVVRIDVRCPRGQRTQHDDCTASVRIPPSEKKPILGVVSRWTNDRIERAVPRLLQENGWSIRRLSRETGVTDAHLSRVLRRAAYKTASGELARRIAIAFGLPEDYFPEFREAFVIDQIKRNSGLRDEIYGRLRKQSPPGTEGD